MPVFKTRLRHGRKGEHNGSHDIPPFGRILENGVPVAVTAVLYMQRPDFSSHDIEAPDFPDHVLDFHSVCPYILNCSGSGFPRDAGKVLRSPEPLPGAPCAEVVPEDT